MKFFIVCLVFFVCLFSFVSSSNKWRIRQSRNFDEFLMIRRKTIWCDKITLFLWFYLVDCVCVCACTCGKTNIYFIHHCIDIDINLRSVSLKKAKILKIWTIDHGLLHSFPPCSKNVSDTWKIAFIQDRWIWWKKVVEIFLWKLYFILIFKREFILLMVQSLCSQDKNYAHFSKNWLAIYLAMTFFVCAHHVIGCAVGNNAVDSCIVVLYIWLRFLSATMIKPWLICLEHSENFWDCTSRREWFNSRFPVLASNL